MKLLCKTLPEYEDLEIVNLVTLTSRLQGHPRSKVTVACKRQDISLF